MNNVMFEFVEMHKNDIKNFYIELVKLIEISKTDNIRLCSLKSLIFCLKILNSLKLSKYVKISLNKSGNFIIFYQLKNASHSFEIIDENIILFTWRYNYSKYYFSIIPRTSKYQQSEIFLVFRNHDSIIH